MKCFYHNDNDGQCAGFWVYAKTSYPYSEFIKINYGQSFPFDEIRPNEAVYIVDYSIEPEEMDRLLDITKDVTWIDHHITAIKKYENYKKEIRGIRYDGIAGCMLTYCYLTHMTEGGFGKIRPFSLQMCQDAPMFTKLIADYDVWTFQYGALSRAFEKGFALYLHEPENDIWKDLLLESDQMFLDEIVNTGYNILNYRKNLMKEICILNGFETELDGYKAFAINMPMIDSFDFESVKDQYDLFIGFSYNGNCWKYSLRSEKINVSEIAVNHGGGGHVGAASFSSTNLILERK